ncbi:MAG: aminotransferase class V-fold PLP-dependent enzyme [Planctomycetaceae bacterium]
MTALDTPSLDVEAIRADFPILRQNSASGMPLVYLDNAASTQHPQVVIDAISDCYGRYYANVHRGIHTMSEASTHAFEKAREVVADFLHAGSLREVIFAAGTTAAINTVARSWGDANITSADTILLTIAEHHANIVPWQQLSQRTGCKIVFLPVADDGTIDDQVVRDALERHRPKLFAFVAVSNVLGTEFPVPAWVKLAHEHGALVLVDAAQAAPHMPIDVVAWDADFVVFSGHKVCGPTGIGVLYGKEALLEAMPPFLGGGAMIHRVTTAGFEPAELPDKFEAGTPPITEAIGLAAALRYIRGVGLNHIHRHEQQLVGRAVEVLSEIEGVRMLGPAAGQRAGILSFTVDGVHAHDVSQWLDTHGVAVRAGHHCAMPLHQRFGISATCRASFYLYNREDEVDVFASAVREVREKFAKSGRKRTRRRGDGSS